MRFNVLKVLPTLVSRVLSLLHRGCEFIFDYLPQEGHWNLRYCGIVFFSVRYFGNFDFNVRYCGLVDPCGIRFFTVSVDGIRLK